MPDITMCNDDTCPSAATCYRNPASGTKPSEWRQSWFAESPRTAAGCRYHSPTNQQADGQGGV